MIALAPVILLLVLAVAYYLYRNCKTQEKKDDLNDGVELWSNNPHHRLSGSDSTIDLPKSKNPEHALNFGMKPSERIPGQKPTHALSFGMKASEKLLVQKPQHALSFGMKASMGGGSSKVEDTGESDWKKLNDRLEKQKPQHALSFGMKASMGGGSSTVEDTGESDWKKLNDRLEKQKPEHRLSMGLPPLEDDNGAKPHHKLSLDNATVPSHDRPQIPSVPSVIRSAPAPPSPRLQQELSVHSIGRIQSFALDDLHGEIETEDTKHIDDLFDDDGDVEEL